MKTGVFAVMVFAVFLVAEVSSQVMKHDDAKLLKTVKATQVGGQTDVKVRAIPATVILAGG